MARRGPLEASDQEVKGQTAAGLSFFPLSGHWSCAMWVESCNRTGLGLNQTGKQKEKGQEVQGICQAVQTMAVVGSAGK